MNGAPNPTHSHREPEEDTTPLLRILEGALARQTEAVTGEIRALRHELRYVYLLIGLALVLLAGVVGVGTVIVPGGVHVGAHAPPAAP